MPKHPNPEALLQLRRVIEATPEDLLHMNVVQERAECGTARCAAGWMASDAWFQNNTPVLSCLRLGEFETRGFSLGTTAKLSLILGINPYDGELLFGGHLSTDDPHSVSKAEVLWNIDALLNGEPARPYIATRESWEDLDVVTGLDFYVPHPEAA